MANDWATTTHNDKRGRACLIYFVNPGWDLEAGYFVTDPSLLTATLRLIDVTRHVVVNVWARIRLIIYRLSPPE